MNYKPIYFVSGKTIFLLYFKHKVDLKHVKYILTQEDCTTLTFSMKWLIQPFSINQRVFFAGSRRCTYDWGTKGVSDTQNKTHNTPTCSAHESMG